MDNALKLEILYRKLLSLGRKLIVFIENLFFNK